MNEFERTVRTTVRNTLYCTIFFAILWALLPRFAPVLSGLTIGSAVGTYFAVSLSRQAQIVADVALFEVRKRPGGIFAFRLLMVFGAFVIAKVVERKIGYVSLPSIVIGFFTYQVVIFGGFLYNKLKTS